MTLVQDPPLAGSSARRRLKGRNERRGSRTGMPVWGALLFGLLFVGAGTTMVLVGQRVITVDPSGVHAPWWVLTVCGLIFAGGGLMVWGMAATQQRAEHHRRAAMQRFAGSPAHADYAWDPRGENSRQWRRAGSAVLMAAFLSVFLSVFNWWAFATRSPVMVKIIVGLFDLILVLVWWEAVVRIGRAFKFGSSRVSFARFPYPMDQPVTLYWVPPRGMSASPKGEFTLRCVEEYYVESGSGKNRSKTLVHDEICSETQSFDQAATFRPGRPVEFRFAVPAGAPSTGLDADRPVYWEFEARLTMPGFDFEERYLVPIYG